MNDMLREFTSYGQFLIPLLTVKHDIEPERVQWGDKQQYFLHYTAPERKADTVVIYLHGGGPTRQRRSTLSGSFSPSPAMTVYC